MSVGSPLPEVAKHQKAIVPLGAKDYKSKINPDWCAGCGDFGVLNALQKVCAELGRMPHEILTVSGIGCSSNFPGFFNAYGMHTLHGRSLAVATGAQLANHELTVIVTGGGWRWLRYRGKPLCPYGTAKHRPHLYCYEQPDLRPDYRSNFPHQ